MKCFIRSRWYNILCLPFRGLISLTILMLVDILQSKNISVNRLIVNCPAVVRVLFYTAGIGSIVIFGVYGVAYDASQFLYFQF